MAREEGVVCYKCKRKLSRHLFFPYALRATQPSRRMCCKCYSVQHGYNLGDHSYAAQKAYKRAADAVLDKGKELDALRRESRRAEINKLLEARQQRLSDTQSPKVTQK